LVAEAEAAALYTLKTQLEIEGDELIAVSLDIQNQMAILLRKSAGRLFRAL
jgi:hypothetical protein